MKKIEFRAFRHLGNVIPVNRLLRDLTDQVNELQDEITALKGGDTATANSAETIIEEVIGTVETESKEDPVDNVPDIDALREQAKAAGIKSWHVKGADTLQDELAAIKTESK